MKNSFYIVKINPWLHKKDYNTIKLYLELLKSEHILFWDYKIEFMELVQIEKKVFFDMKYGVN